MIHYTRARKLFLKKRKDKDEGINIQRIQIEALDFDWIFAKDNMKDMVKLLNSKANENIFKQESI